MCFVCFVCVCVCCVCVVCVLSVCAYICVCVLCVCVLCVCVVCVCAVCVVCVCVFACLRARCVCLCVGAHSGPVRVNEPSLRFRCCFTFFPTCDCCENGRNAAVTTMQRTAASNHRTVTQQHIFSALQWRAFGLFLNRGHLRQCRWPKCPFDSFAKCPFWLDRGWDSVEIEELPVSKCDWGQPGKPEHGVFSVKACHLSVIVGGNRGHLPLEKVTYASVGPPCVSVIRVSLRLDLPSIGPAPV